MLRDRKSLQIRYLKFAGRKIKSVFRTDKDNNVFTSFPRSSTASV